MNKYIREWYFEDIIAHIDKFELGTKIKSERGDIYNLSQAEGEGKQRKFSRWNGTRLRFMTYENIGKKFEILEDNTEEKGDDTKMNKSSLKEGDTVRVRSTRVPKGFNFTYKYGIGSIGKVLSNAEHKDFRSVIVEFGNDIKERDSYYEDDLDLIDNTEEIEELLDYRTGENDLYNDNFDDMFRKINELVKEFNKMRKDLNK